MTLTKIANPDANFVERFILPVFTSFIRFFLCSVAADASAAASRSPSRGMVTERRSSPKDPSTFGRRRIRRRILDEEDDVEEVVVGANAKTTGLDIDEDEVVEVQQVTAISERTVNPTSSPRHAVLARPMVSSPSKSVAGKSKESVGNNPR